MANTDAILGILPLGTSNDSARSPDIPLRLADAVRPRTSGKLSTSDIVQFVDEDDGSTTFDRAVAPVVGGGRPSSVAAIERDLNVARRSCIYTASIRQVYADLNRVVPGAFCSSLVSGHMVERSR